MTPEARAAFIVAHTAVGSPVLVPELSLYLASEVTELWQATEETLRRHDLPVPFWAFAWPGSIALARYLLDNPGTVAGRRVLDFGAGSGLAAIAAMRSGASSAVAIDIDRFAITSVGLNAGLNDVAVEARYAEVIGDPLADVDVILAGDICYERPLAERAHVWFRDLVRAGKTVLLADPGRNFLLTDGLAEIYRLEVPTSRDLEDQDVRSTALWRVLP